VTALHVDGDVKLTPHAEMVFQREAERVGAYAVDPDEALVSGAAFNFLADVELVLVASL